MRRLYWQKRLFEFVIATKRQTCRKKKSSKGFRRKANAFQNTRGYNAQNTLSITDLLVKSQTSPIKIRKRRD